MKSPIYLLFSIILISASSVSAAAQRGTVRGTVTASGEDSMSSVHIHLKNTNYSSASDRHGSYSISAPAGTYTLVCTAVGYEDYKIEIELEPARTARVDIELLPSSINIDNVEVRTKSQVRRINETSYNVVAIDARALHNTTLDLAHALDRVSGVKIRESGGVGSGAQISLNGFSGRHVKVFMDGIPMDGGGSSFQLNNIPVSLAERIEVYKGVVPVELGADALGGAINVVTRGTANTYFDASYSYGSFNTHKSSVNFGHVTPRGLVVQLNAYQNYSDNSYKVKTQLLNLETNTFTQEEYWFKRFHDIYRNEAVVARFGVTGKKWATRLLFGVTYSQERDEIQNANLMKIVYGGKIRESRSISPSLNYELKNFITRNLDLSLSANYNTVRSNSADTLARQYNWKGEHRVKGSKGEGTYTLSETDNNTFYVTGNLRYRIGRKHFITVNNVFNGYSRKATDAAANAENSTATTFMKRTSNKNVLGMSYKFAASDKLNLSAFGKYYNIAVTGPVDVSTGTSAVYEEKRKTYGTTGYGLAGTYILLRDFQLKVSYEQAYRLPSERELFGDEVLETGDAALKPENSRNVNLNLGYNREFTSGHAVYAEAGFIFRDTRDYIRRQIEQRYGGAYYANHGRIRTVGADFEARYFFRNKLSVGGNLTWQNIRNKERYSITGQELIYYNDRMPNVPYMFSNADASYNFHNIFCKGSVLTLSYNLNYVHEFFRNWESEGGDIIIPGQLSHDLSVTYSFGQGRYNVALEANNFTNEMLYDNYSLQKPGRSFMLKLRYSFFKSRKTDARRAKAESGRRHGGKHGHGGQG